MRIEIIGLIEQIDPNNDNADVMLHLDDGRKFSFLVATPNNIYWCMDNEGMDFFVGVPPVLVRRLTQENVEAALRALLESPETLKAYGSLQEEPS